MRILTVRPPWAWVIVHGGKDVENRVRNIAGAYRGPVAIHAGQAVDLSAFSGRSVALTAAAKAFNSRNDDPLITAPWLSELGAIIGVVDLVDVHHAAECVYVGPVVEDFDGEFVSQEITYCSAWAEAANVYHLVLANPRALAEPIPYRGALGLRTLDDHTAARVLAQIGTPS
jgi:hypothetical protein